MAQKSHSQTGSRIPTPPPPPRLFLLICGIALILSALLLACATEGTTEQPAETGRQPTATTERAAEEATSEEEDSPTPEATRRGIFFGQSTSPETDREALIALFNATNGEGGYGTDNWGSSAPIAEWNGVTTDEEGRVIELKYGDADSFSGELPPELGNLSSLERLAIYNTPLSGEIPPELGNLTNLRDLDLHGNELTGEIPPELGNLTNLQGLALGDNQLSGEIPPELGNLTNLQHLSLGDQLSGEIPPELGNLINLEGLFIIENQLSGEIPPELGNLTKLQWLDLSYNQLSGKIPPELGNLTNLAGLRLSGNQLSGCISTSPPPSLSEGSENYCTTQASVPTQPPFQPTEAPPAPTAAPQPTQPPAPVPTQAPAPTATPRPTATPMPTPTPTPRPRFTPLLPSQTSAETDKEALVALFNATEGETWDGTNSWLGRGAVGGWQGVTTDANGRVIGLELYGLIGDLPPELGNLTSLIWLLISSSQLDGGIPPELGNLANLQWLAIVYNELDGEIPPQLGNLTGLRAMYLSHNQLSGEIPRELGKLTSLGGLGLENNQLSGQIPPELENTALGLFLDLTAIPERLANEGWRWGGISGNNFSGCVSDYFAEYMDGGTGLGKCAAPPDHPGDTETLIALYEAWGQPGWENWLGRVPIADWEGISIDSGGRVAALAIHNRDIYGRELMPELGNLTGLRMLSLPYPSGEIPPELGNLTSLKMLYLHGDALLRGQIPPQLCNLTNLGYLVLDGANLRNYGSAFENAMYEEGVQAALKRFICP